jgi:predicted kinase
MINCVRRVAALGMSVIVDSPLSKQSLYYRMKTVAEESKGFVVIVECKSSNTELWAKRLRSRGQNSTRETCHKPASMADIEELVQKYQGAEKWHLHEEGLKIFSVDTTTLSTKEQVNMARNYILNVMNNP